VGNLELGSYSLGSSGYPEEYCNSVQDCPWLYSLTAEKVDSRKPVYGCAHKHSLCTCLDAPGQRNIIYPEHSILWVCINIQRSPRGSLAVNVWNGNRATRRGGVRLRKPEHVIRYTKTVAFIFYRT
jgi:hypothetical protein